MTTSDMGASSEAQDEEVEETWRDDDTTELPSLPPTRAKKLQGGSQGSTG